jgi:hypothetical protein
MRRTIFRDSLHMRRTLLFNTPDDVLNDCLQLATGPCTMLGQWTLAQNVRHLARGIDCFYEGFGFEMNWFLRTFLGGLLKRRILKRGMPAGIRLPATAERLLPPNEDADLLGALEHLKASVRRLKQEPPTHPHPVFGQMTHDEVRILLLRHAELHLSFAVPQVAATAR